MTNYNKFLCRVTPAGVPHSLPVIFDYQQAILQNIDPRDICKVFWLIKSLNVSYLYAMNGVAIKRSFTATTTNPPINRIVNSALIYHNGTDDYTGSDYHVLLDLSKIYYDNWNSGCYGIRMTFEESDAYYLYNIGFVQKANMANVSCKTTFLGCDLTIFLNYNQSYISTAEISNFVLTPTYCEIN